MKKSILMGFFILFLIGCGLELGDPFSFNGYEPVESKVNIYFDNLSSQDVKATVLLRHATTFGGITLEKNTTGSVIQLDFENVYEGEGDLGVEITTSDSAIQYFTVTPFEFINITGEKEYAMKYSKNYITITDNSQSTLSSINVEVEHK